MSSPSPSPGKRVDDTLAKMRLATNRPEWMKTAAAKKVTTSLSLTAEASTAASSGLSLAAEATTAASSGQCASTLEPKPGNLPWIFEDEAPSQPSPKKMRKESVLDSLILNAQPSALCWLCNKMTCYCTCTGAPVTPNQAPLLTSQGSESKAGRECSKTPDHEETDIELEEPPNAASGAGSSSGDGKARASTDAPKTAKGNEPVTPKANADGKSLFPPSPVAYFEQIIKPKLGPSASPDKIKDSLMEWISLAYPDKDKDLLFPTYDDLRAMAPMAEVKYGNTLLYGLAESRPKEGMRLMLKLKDLKSGKTNQMGSMVFQPREEVNNQYPKVAWLYLDCLQLLMMFCKHWESLPKDIRSYHAQLKEVFMAEVWPQASFNEFLARL